MSDHSDLLNRAMSAKYSFAMAGLKSLADEIGTVRKNYRLPAADPGNALAVEVERLVRKLYDDARALRPEQFDSVPPPEPEPDNTDEDLLA